MIRHFLWLDCQGDGTCLYAFLRKAARTPWRSIQFRRYARAQLRPAQALRLPCPGLLTWSGALWRSLPEETPAVRSRAAREGHVLTFPVPAFSGLVLELDAPDGSRMTGKPNQ
jgi:1,4-alpha-glucan branching enzyme